MKKSLFILAAWLMVFSPVWGDGRHIIAHRGYWNTEGSSQNSCTALKKALQLGVYSSECDVRMTADGQLYLLHDGALDGRWIEERTAAEIKNLRLSNGEKIPQLEDFLKILKKSKNPTKLFIEIKTEKTPECALKAIAMVKKYGLEDRVEWEASTLPVLQEIIKNTTARVYTMDQTDLTVRQLHDLGFGGLDYRCRDIRQHPEWVKEAHDLGMKVSVWHVNDPALLKEMLGLGVDLITTDKPEEMARLIL